MKKTLFIILTLSVTTLTLSQDTLRIATYNTLKFPEKTHLKRMPYFRQVIEAMDPDILVLQELTSANGVTLFRNEIMNYYQSGEYTSAPFVDGFDTDNMLFYKKSQFDLIANRQIDTALRDISEYVLQYKSSRAPMLWVYSLHLKASSQSTQQRQQEAEILRNVLNQNPASANFFVAGDFNVYNASEPAFQTFISNMDNNNGRCYDPINQIGNWHNSSYYAKWHTQSTRTTNVDDGASGGLDDRFDFVLVSKSLLDKADWKILPDTYQSFGNNGKVFNLDINHERNTSVPDSIANALYYASDHLPVCVDFVWNDPTAIDQKAKSVANNFELYNCYPNPFNSSTVISYAVKTASEIQLDIFNLNGQWIETIQKGYHTAGQYKVVYQPQQLNSGIYFIRLTGTTNIKVTKALYVK